MSENPPEGAPPDDPSHGRGARGGPMAPRHTAPDAATRGTGRAEVALSVIVAACVLVQAVVAKEVLDVELDYFSQFAALWVYIAFVVADRRDRATIRAFAVVAVAVTAAVLVLYAV